MIDDACQRQSAGEDADPTKSSDFDFRALGPLEVWVGDERLDVPGRSMRSLLGAFLLHPGEAVSEPRLATLIWGGNGGTRGALRTAVTRLRGWLREAVGLAETVDHTAGGYRFRVPVENIDVGRFQARARYTDAKDDPRERAQELLLTLGIWRGAVLSGTTEWLHQDPVVMSLENARARCVIELADIALYLGEPYLALSHLERLAPLRPYDEALQARFMAVLGECGHRVEGLKVFERARRKLADEFGVGPSAELAAGYLKLLRQDGYGTDVTR